jgi:hypothetical protein
MNPDDWCVPSEPWFERLVPEISRGHKRRCWLSKPNSNLHDALERSDRCFDRETDRTTDVNRISDTDSHRDIYSNGNTEGDAKNHSGDEEVATSIPSDVRPSIDSLG